mmetsp:Transcript_48504/g.113543  ORF Transcript_48504/g.113543 Transcript_48504/m.113543 type:complete len:260 (-) Transcript_48504:543-1322(-)
MLVAPLLRLLSFGCIKVRVLLELFLRSFHFAQGIASLSTVVLRERLVVHLNALIKLFLDLVHTSHTSVDFAHLLERRSTRVCSVDLVPAIQHILTQLENLVQALTAHLDPHRALVVVICQVVGLLLQGLVIHSDRLLELLLLIEFIALRLEFVRFLLLWSTVVWGRRLFFLLLWHRRLGRGGWLVLVKIKVTAWSCCLDVNALHRHDDLQDSWVLLHCLHHQRLTHLLVGVAHLADHLHLLHQSCILHVLLDLWILCSC